MSLADLSWLGKESLVLLAIAVVLYLLWKFTNPIVTRIQNGSAKKDQRDYDIISTLIQGSREESREVAKHISTSTSVMGTLTTVADSLAAEVRLMRHEMGITNAREEERNRVRTQQWDSVQDALRVLALRRQEEQLHESQERATTRAPKKLKSEVLA